MKANRFGARGYPCHTPTENKTCTLGMTPHKKIKHCRKYEDHEDDVQTHATEACRLEHKLTPREHPDKYACIHPKTKRPDKKPKDTPTHASHSA